MITGWLEARELPASEHLRTVAEILSAPASPEERRARRREEAEAEAKRASAADTADNAAAAAIHGAAERPRRRGTRWRRRRPVSRSGTVRRPPGAGPRSTRCGRWAWRT